MPIPARTLPLLMATLLALALSGCGKSPEEHVQSGRAFLEKAEHKSAVLELKSALQEQPKNREARILLGNTYLAMGAFSEAEKELTKAQQLGAEADQVLAGQALAQVKQGQFQKVADIAPPASGLSPRSLALLQVARSEALWGLGRQEEAVRVLDEAAKADATLPQVLLLRAKIAMAEKRFPEALQLADAALAKDGRFFDALYLKGLLQQIAGKPDEALASYQQIVAKDPGQYRAHLAQHQIVARQGKPEEAEKSLKAAEKVAGALPVVKYYRALFEIQRSKLREANDALLQVLKAAPNYGPAVLAHGMVSYGLGNYEQGLKSAQKFLVTHPDNPIALRILAGSQMKTGDVAAAKKSVQALLRVDEGTSQNYQLAADIYFEANELDTAMDYMDRAVAKDPDNPNLRLLQARAHMQLGEDGRALADLEKAATLSGKPGQADLALISLYIQRGQHDQALTAIAGLEKKLPQSPLPYNLRGTVLSAKGDLPAARGAFEKALALKPDSIPPTLGLARLEIQAKNWSGARKRLEAGLSRKPDELQYLMALADVAAAQQNEADYRQFLEKAIKAHPEAVLPVRRLISHHLQKQEPAKALELARQAAKANPNSPGALALLGAVQAQTGAGSESVASFASLVEKNRNSPQAHLQLALAQIKNKQPAEARESLKRALALKADYVEAQDALLRLEMSQSRTDAALAIARDMQKQNARSGLGHVREADIHYARKQYPQAMAAYEQALARQPDNATFIKLHRVMTLAGDVKGADRRLATWLASHGRDTAVRGYAAAAYLAAGRYREAIGQYEAVVKLEPNNFPALNNLAELYLREKDPRALATAQMAGKLAPQNPGVLDTQGWITVNQGDLAQGIALLRKASTLAPDVPTIRYHLAAALVRQGDKAEAKKLLGEVLKSGKAFPESKEAQALLATL